MAGGPGAAGAARKYDRQVRVWGAEGQGRLGGARVAVLGLGPAGSEAAKNLALGGVGHITLVDGQACSEEDVGNNFFCDREGLGRPRAEVCCRLLRELNPEVGMAYVESDPTAPELVKGRFLQGLALIVAAGLPRPALAVLDAACRENGVALVAVQSLGLAGTVRLSLREHCVWDSKPDTPAPDLRLDRPWPALAAHCAAAALPGDPEALRALPWAALVIRAAATWRDAHEGRAPGRTDAGAFRARLLTLAGGSGEETAEGPGSDAAAAAALAEEPENLREARAHCHRVWAPLPACPTELAAVLADGQVDSVLEGGFRAGPESPPGPESAGSGATSTSTVGEASEPPSATASGGVTAGAATGNADFWVLAAALRLFREREGELPLNGSLPDMASTSDQYVALQRVYAAKAAADAKAVGALVSELLERQGRAPDEIAPATIAQFCRDCRGLQVVRYPPFRTPADAAGDSPADAEAENVEALRQLLRDEETRAAASVYAALQASDAFIRHHSRHPGCFQGGPETSGGDVGAADLERDTALLKQLAGSDADGLQDDYVREAVRAGGTQLHTAGALLGGIAAQEAIKLLTRTFVPQRGTLVWDGIACATHLLQLA